MAWKFYKKKSRTFQEAWEPCQGCHASWKVLDFWVKFPGPGKSWKMGLDLEILVQCRGKSWNFIGYDVGGGHNDAGADAKICKN